MQNVLLSFIFYTVPLSFSSISLQRFLRLEKFMETASKLPSSKQKWNIFMFKINENFGVSNLDYFSLTSKM